MPMPAPTHASLWLRLAAAVYDLFPLIALWMLSAGLFLLAAHGRVDVAHPPFAYRFALRLTLFAISAAYFVISWSRGGQTIGMRAWRLRVVDSDGNALPWPRALLRFVVALAGLLPFGIGFWWCLIERNHHAWHDWAAQSAVLRIPSS